MEMGLLFFLTADFCVFDTISLEKTGACSLGCLYRRLFLKKIKRYIRKALLLAARCSAWESLCPTFTGLLNWRKIPQLAFLGCLWGEACILLPWPAPLLINRDGKGVSIVSARQYFITTGLLLWENYF